MKNKYGVKISKAERDYMNSLKRSIRRTTKNIETLIQPYQKVSYLRRKSSTTFTPVIKKTTVNTFKTREEFLNELEKLTKIKSELSINKPRKPKQYDELPKRLQDRVNTEERKFKRRAMREAKRKPKVETEPKPKTPKTTKPKVNLEKLLKLPFIDKRNETYRQNMIKSFIDVFDPKTASTFIEQIESLSESQFMDFFLSFGPEVISYVYHDPSENLKVQRLYQELVSAKNR